MGATPQAALAEPLPAPVLSTVVERHRNEIFSVGVAETNGWRHSMEDAHVALMRSDWAFFGVLDGHGANGHTSLRVWCVTNVVAC